MEFKGFTIEVKKRGKDEEFSFKDLEMFHQECYGGRIRLDTMYGHFYTGYTSQPLLTFHELICKRCNTRLWIIKRSQAELDIVNTAIDGQCRDVEGYQGELELIDQYMYRHTYRSDLASVSKWEIKGIDNSKDVKVRIAVVQKT